MNILRSIQRFTNSHEKKEFIKRINQFNLRKLDAKFNRIAELAAFEAMALTASVHRIPILEDLRSLVAKVDVTEHSDTLLLNAASIIRSLESKQLSGQANYTLDAQIAQEFDLCQHVGGLQESSTSEELNIFGTTDTVVIMGEAKVRAHSAVLASRSEV